MYVRVSALSVPKAAEPYWSDINVKIPGLVLVTVSYMPVRLIAEVEPKANVPVLAILSDWLPSNVIVQGEFKVPAKKVPEFVIPLPLDVEVEVIVVPLFAVKVPALVIMFVPLQVTLVPLKLNMPVTTGLVVVFKFLIFVPLPLAQLIADEVMVTIPPVFVKAVPTAILMVAVVTLNVPPELLFKFEGKARSTLALSELEVREKVPVLLKALPTLILRYDVADAGVAVILIVPLLLNV